MQPKYLTYSIRVSTEDMIIIRTDACNQTTVILRQIQSLDGGRVTVQPKFSKAEIVPIIKFISASSFTLLFAVCTLHNPKHICR